MMKRRIFGLESEYGAICTSEGRSVLTPELLARYLFDELVPSTRYPNVFLENGARLYVDTGFHPEYATPECDDLLDLVAYDRAGERIVEDLVRHADRRLADHHITGRVQAFKNNTDSVGNSYGCHENYLVSRHTPFPYLVEALVPFFVSRQILAGAGRICRGPTGYEYHLSQRAEHIVDEVSGTTVAGRPMINTRDEPHADGERFRRLHVIVGDSSMSEVTTYLKVGTTALVLDVLEDGCFRENLGLESAVGALRAISRDPTLRQRVRLRDGRSLTALEIQLVFLEACDAHVRRAGADVRAQALLARWEDVLTRLGRDPMTADRHVDWVIKKGLVDRYVARHGASLADPRVRLLDLQYHDLRSDRGLYHLLARRGKVETLVSDQAVERAKHAPPQTTRARLRGDFIRRANLRGWDYQVDWAYVRTMAPENQIVVCEDPFLAHDQRIERLAA
jgi:proteasome accessory factor A